MINTIKKLLGVNIVTQIIGIMIYPIILFFYSIEDLSIYGMLFGAMAIFSILLSFRVENLFFSIKLKDAYTLYGCYIKYIFLPMLMFFGVLFYFFIGVKNQFLSNFIIAIICGGFLAGFNVTYNILVRLGNEKYNFLKIMRAILELLFVIIAINLKMKISLLFLFAGFTYFLVTVYPIVICLFKNRRVCDLKKYFRLVSLDMTSSLMNTIYLYSPNYFLYFGINKNLSGYYFIINRFFGVPSIMIAQSMSTALKQYLAGKAQERYRDTLQNFNSNIFSRIYKIYISFSLFSIFIFYIFDRLKYDQLIYVFLIILPLMIFRFKFIVYSSLFYVLRDYVGNIKLQFSLFLVGGGAFIFGWFFDNSWLSLVIYSIVSLFVYRYFISMVINKVPSI